jgi:hypothetical protein
MIFPNNRIKIQIITRTAQHNVAHNFSYKNMKEKINI